ncbi:MAG TPA: hypothetical protein VD997_05950 [Phycisphaerales bacterium]|nr:hypothetical protein [Phycisphaerales bacterium]
MRESPLPASRRRSPCANAGTAVLPTTASSMPAISACDLFIPLGRPDVFFWHMALARFRGT